MYIHFFETYRVTKKIFIRLFWLNVRNPRTEHGIGVFSLKVRKWGKGGRARMDGPIGLNDKIQLRAQVW